LATLAQQLTKGSGMSPDVALSSLFVSAFLSSTLLPGSSEVVLAALVAQSPALLWPAIAVATIGNTLGGLTSYALGRLVPQPKARPRALAFAQRFGVAALLLSWLPVIGDALCVASGWLRHNVILATLAIAAGKLLRYIALAAAVRRLAG
jgi:membrane protein YqaA with SNARE-associated domain